MRQSAEYFHPRWNLTLDLLTTSLQKPYVSARGAARMTLCTYKIATRAVTQTSMGLTVSEFNFLGLYDPPFFVILREFTFAYIHVSACLLVSKDFAYI